MGLLDHSWQIPAHLHSRPTCTHAFIFTSSGGAYRCAFPSLTPPRTHDLCLKVNKSILDSKGEQWQPPYLTWEGNEVRQRQRQILGQVTDQQLGGALLRWSPLFTFPAKIQHRNLGSHPWHFPGPLDKNKKRNSKINQ